MDRSFGIGAAEAARPGSNRGQRYEELRSSLSAGIFTPAAGGELEFYQCAGLLIYQLSLAEKMLKPALYDKRIEDPFMWGYVFGVAACAIDRAGWERESVISQTLTVALHQEVWGPIDQTETACRSSVAMQCPRFGEGMIAGGEGLTTVVACGDKSTIGAVQFLARGAHAR